MPNRELEPKSTTGENIEVIRGFKGADILTARQFDRGTIDILFEKTDKMKRILEGKEKHDYSLAGRNLGLLFFKSSIQTRTSLQIAMKALGGNTVEISTQELNEETRLDKDTFEDKILVLANNYIDAIAVRPPEVGMSKIAADVSRVPIINAGEGKDGENPGQALSVLCTIKEFINSINLDGLTITFCGNLRNDHTIHSLTLLLSNYKNIKINLVPPIARFQLEEELIGELKSKGVDVNEARKLEELSQNYGILYLNRPSTEEKIIRRLGSPVSKLIENLGHIFTLPPQAYSQARFVLSPAPRLEEIKESPHAVNYVQVTNGVPVRMALLSLILTGK